MKIVKRMFEMVRPNFVEDGKLSVMKPLYEALENFCFAPGETTEFAPYARDASDLKRYMTMVIIGLLPALAAGYYFFGLRIIAMIIVSYMAGGIVEVAFACIRKEPIAEGFLVTGLIFPMALPPGTPLWMVAVGVMFGVFFGKELFGGTGRNLFNPAILGRCFLALAYPKIMAEAWIAPGTGLTGNMFKWMSVDFGPDAVTVATPLGLAKTGAMITELPKMIMGNIPGSMAETCAVMVILGGVFLVLTKVANWRSIVSTIGSALIMATVLYMIDSERFISPVWHLFAGSLLFGAFFMATDPVSSPSTNAGKWIYGAIIGMTAMLLRNFGNYPEGMMFGILLGNVFAPIIDELIFTIRLRRLANEG